MMETAAVNSNWNKSSKMVVEEASHDGNNHDMDDDDAPIDFNEDHSLLEDANYMENDGDESEDDFESLVKAAHERALIDGAKRKPPPSNKLTSTTERKPEVVDDFIRNFLLSRNLTSTLETFQDEWYAAMTSGKLTAAEHAPVPDVYAQLQLMSETIRTTQAEIQEFKDIAEKARSTYNRLRKERDFHKTNFTRVTQEKAKLLSDIKSLKSQNAIQQPLIHQLQHKYELSAKEKMLTRLERDKLVAKIEFLQKSMQTLELNGQKPPFPSLPAATAISSSNAEKRSGGGAKESILSHLPAESRKNKFHGRELASAHIDGYKIKNFIRAHDAPISSIKLNSDKMILASVSDDRTLKLWQFPTGEPLATCQGHTDWIADLDFHPTTPNLVLTASGDFTLKLWDTSKSTTTATTNNDVAAISTLTDHTQAVWSCAFHDMGEVAVSGSMDHTVKLWDLSSGKCRHTFRGHVDSVNYVTFSPNTNIILSCSGDKSIALWDARTGLCSQILLGHCNTINHVTFSLSGTQVASCDGDGFVKFWDLRNIAELESLSVGGGRPVNKVCFDPSGSLLAAACDDGTCKFVQNASGKTIKALAAHENASTQAALFDISAEYFVTAGSDGVVKVWM